MMGGTRRGRSTLLIAACAGLFTLINCGAASTTGPDPTTLPTGIILTGAWSGAIARASGLSTLGVSWVDKPSSSFALANLTFFGPVTLSRDADRLAGTLSVTLGGTPASPTLSLALAVDPGAPESTLASCAIAASAAPPTSVTNTSMMATVSISFSGCPSLVNGRASATETAVLTLEKLYVR